MASSVRPLKQLGQHFLNDQAIAERIAGALSMSDDYDQVLEIGPGTGFLTEHLVPRCAGKALYCIEIDQRSVDYLGSRFPSLAGNIISEDFLTSRLVPLGERPFAVIGNFPYYISSQILFRVYDMYRRIPEMVGMFQKEVAQRIASGPGSRDYGIPSVLLQAHYDIGYLFTVPPSCFTPPPAVESGVIRMVRKKNPELPCNEEQFRKVVKTAFNQRRKTMRNSLRSLLNPGSMHVPFLDKRPEQLGWEEFVLLTKSIFPG
jgi:16S rRNA (adenine1518-N6/adenine1519-N6)-dimethyltransferase